MTSDDDRHLLLAIAREALQARALGRDRARRTLPGSLVRPAGAFVTLHRRGELRGCIGHILPDRALSRVVAECAVAAGYTDPRFSAITVAELDELTIEISVLGPLEPADGPDDVVVGRHGVIVESRGRQGLLLPQVAVEGRWDSLTFIVQTCRKAGLPPDAWQSGATLWRFEAEVFAER